MKLGRNEECHCGSGKKYKKCCLKSDQKSQREKSQSKSISPAFAELKETLSKAFEKEDSGPPDPLDPLRDEFWNEFSDSNTFTEKITLTETMLLEQPELCSPSIAFEVATELYEKLEDENDYERYLQFTQTLEKQAPESWDKEKHYLLDYQAIVALFLGDFELARAAFLRFSECADRDLELYDKLISYFAWHGQDELIVEGLAKARVAVKAAKDKFLQGTYEELCYQQANYDLLDTISKLDEQQLQDVQNNPLPEIQAFRERLTTIDETEGNFIQDKITETLSYILNEKQVSSVLEDYKIDKELHLYQQENEDMFWDEDEDEDDDHEEELEEDPAKVHLNGLIHQFKHYGYFEENIPMPHLLEGSYHLYRFLLARGFGDLDNDEPSLFNTPKIKRKKHGQKTKPQEIPLEATHPLIFTTQEFKRYMKRYGYRFLFTPYHNLGSFLEIVPVWLRFLNKLEFLNKDRNQDILIKLKLQVEELNKLCESATHDKALVAKLQNWPE